VTTTNMDSLGRVTDTIVGNVRTDITYDGLGRVLTRSNPYFVGGSTDGNTGYLYDALDRTIRVARQDGSAVTTKYSGNLTTVTDETGRQRKSYSDARGRLIEVDEPTDIYSSGQPFTPPSAGTGAIAVSGTLQSWPTQTVAATQATGYAVVGGALKSTPVVTQTAAAGTGYVTISGSLQSVTITYQCGQYQTCQRTQPESGNIVVVINGRTEAIPYGSCNTSAQAATAVAGGINNDTGSPVYASASGSTVYLTAKTTGAATNYSLSVSTTGISGGASRSYSVSPSGANLTGGRDQITTTVYDSGTASITINGQAISYGWSGSSTTPSSIAIGLSQALNTSSSYVTSTYSGATVYFTSKASGASTNYGLSSGSTWNTTYFGSGSFSVSSSGGALTGGNDAQYVTNYDSGTTTASIDGYIYSFNWSGSSTSALSIATGLASVISGDPGSPVNATLAGTTVGLTAKSPGAISNYSLSTSTTSTRGSFASGSGSALTGGSDGQSSFSSAYVTLYGYDALDNLLSVQQKGNAASGFWRNRSFAYDSLSRLVTANNPESGTICYGTLSGGTCTEGYDPNSNLLYKTDARGITTTYAYDAENRVYQKTHSDGTNTLSYTYDSGTFAGITPSNPVHHLLHISNNVNVASTYSYDSMGRTVSETNCIPSDCNDAHNPVTASYDQASNLTQLTYPSGTIAKYQYNSNGWLYRSYPTSGSDYVNVAAFMPSGAWQTANYGNGTQESDSYNNRLQPLRLKLLKPGGTSAWGDRSYVWTGCSEGITGTAYNNGNVCGITDNLNSTYNQTFNYDVLNRIISAQQSDGAVNQAFSYDAWGNINMGGNGVPNNYLVGYSTNNRVTTYTYDAAGNIQDMGTSQIPHTFAWDAEGELTAYNGTAATYTYDANGNRARKTVGANWSEYIYFGGNIIAEKSPSGWADYVFAGGKRIYQTGTAVPSQYYWADHLGSTSVLSDTTGANVQITHYAPFGQEVDAGGLTTHYKFTGKERDYESGIDYFGARDYGPNGGRFTSPDPGNQGAADADPQSWNAYSYVRNSPLLYTDPNGTDVQICTFRTDGLDRKSCYTLSDQKYSDLYSEQNGKQGITMPELDTKDNIYANGNIMCGGQQCGTTRYVEPGMVDHSMDFVGFAAALRGLGTIWNSISLFSGTSNSGNGRLPQDENVNPAAPPARDTGTIGTSPAQHQALAKDIENARAEGATDIRVNQNQVNAAGERVGINRPDLQYTDRNGIRHYIEYERTDLGRGEAHADRIMANDPAAVVVIKIVP